jgi:PBP1b-binding outer membrane lipoprotein LpoB
MRSSAAALILAVLFAGCSTISSLEGEKPVGPLGRVAVLRMERGEATADAALGGNREESPSPALPPHAEAVVTAQIYGILANDPRWRLVPDLDIDDAMRQVPMGGTLESRAQALGKEAKADAVITGRVARFQERVGGEYGSRHPASVAFQLELVETATGNVLWSGAFDQTQQPLTSNLFDFWMFWSGGPHWFTAAELARLGVEKLVAEMDTILEEK